MNNITLDEFKDIFKYLINNNKRLVEDGKYPIAIGIEGAAGLGKTTVLKDLADEMGMTCVKCNLAEFEEVSDLTGFPIKEYQIDCDGIQKWIPADLISNCGCEEYQFTGETRMSYATPSWLPREENPNGTIIILDDYTRANSLFMQATMELICTGKYSTWSLPNNTTIVLSSNPDSGEYSVSSLDPAQKSRFINFPIRFNIDSWSKWAENNHIDGRAINFALSYSHEIFERDEPVQTINPRSYVTFCNAISGIPDWSQSESLAMIMNIAKGCFTDKDNIIGHLFTTFIANKLDKLVTPEDMLMKPWSTVKTQIKNCVYDDNGNYRPDVASVLHTRLLNYSLYYFEQKGAKTEVVQDRLLELIDAPDEVNAKGEKIGCMLFSEDFLFDIIRTLMKKFPTRTNKFMLNKKIRSKVM